MSATPATPAVSNNPSSSRTGGVGRGIAPMDTSDGNDTNTRGLKRTISKATGTGEAFMLGAEPKVRKIAAPMDADDAKKKAEEKRLEVEAFKAKVQTIRDEYAVPIQKEFEGAIRFFNTNGSIERYAPTREWTRIALDREDQQPLFVNAAEKRTPWVWVAVYDDTDVETECVRHFKDALERIDSMGHIDFFDSTRYNPLALKRANRRNMQVFVVFCATEMDRQRLLIHKGIAFKDESYDMAFFLQDMRSDGNMIVLDLHNAPAEEADVIRGCLKSLMKAILWKVQADDKLEAVRFAIAKIEWKKPAFRADGAGRGAPPGAAGPARPNDVPNGNRWRIAFRPNTDEMSKGWKLPATVGVYGSKGEVTVHRPPFCTACISYSHSRDQCSWWKEGSLLENPKRPSNYSPLSWKVINDLQPFRKAKDKGKMVEKVPDFPMPPA